MGKARAATQTQDVILDAGPLIALESGDRRMIALIRRTLAARRDFYVPAGVVAQVWRNGARQVTLARFLKSREVKVESLDERAARAVGELCGATGTSDVVDASVVLVAQAFDGVVVTSDPDDLRRLDGNVRIERI